VVLVRAATVVAEEPGRMAIIEMHQRAVAFSQGTDLIQFCDAPVHGEHAIGGDQLEARTGGIGRL
jgi:hypothetical protein